MTTAEMAKQKNEFSLSRRVSTVLANAKGKPSRITASADGTLPTSFELLKVGMWRTPYHGDIMIMPEDLQDYVDNWKEGCGVSGDGTLKLPINFNHDEGGKAAGWFDLAIEGDVLMATNVEWSDAGKAGLLGNEWKCISAEFWPAGRGGWPDPLDYERYVDNVIDGAALTNIPLFSQLKPVMASAVSGKGDNKNQVFFITASQNKESIMPTLEDVRTKKAADLTEEEKTFATEHKAEFTAEEQAALGFEVSPADPAPAPAPVATAPEQNANINPEENKEVNKTEVPAEVAASLKTGESVVVKASTLARLEDTDKQYRTEKAEQIVKAHIARGALKADQLGIWSGKLVNASTEERKELESMLTNLPNNQLMADTQGKENTSADLDERDLITAKAKEKVDAARKEGKTLDLKTAISEATSEVQKENESK